MKMKRIALAAAFTALCLCGCSSSDAKKERTEITVLAAASLTESCEDIEKMYEAEHSGTDLVFSFGGSGALQIQIEEGAPADIFLSAGKKQMDALVDEKLVDSSSVNDLLENKVVLIVPEGSKAEIRGFEDVISDKVGVIALGEPSSVPVVQYSEEIFGRLGRQAGAFLGGDRGRGLRSGLFHRCPKRKEYQSRSRGSRGEPQQDNISGRHSCFDST